MSSSSINQSKTILNVVFHDTQQFQPIRTLHSGHVIKKYHLIGAFWLVANIVLKLCIIHYFHTLKLQRTEQEYLNHLGNLKHSCFKFLLINCQRLLIFCKFMIFFYREIFNKNLWTLPWMKSVLLMIYGLLSPASPGIHAWGILIPAWLEPCLYNLHIISRIILRWLFLWDIWLSA